MHTSATIESYSIDPRDLDKRVGVNVSQTLKSVVYGVVFFAPVGTKYYALLETLNIPLALTPKSLIVNALSKHSKLITQVIPRVLVDQLMYAPCACAFYYVMMGVFDGVRDWEQIKETRLKPNWWPTFTTSLAVWPAFQLINFSIVPSHYRLLAVNVMNVGWNSYLSYRSTYHSKPIKLD